MKKKLFLLIIIFILIFVFIYQILLKKHNIGLEKANIILITVDALRADHLSVYGYKYETSPNIDAFAKRSVLFNYAFCPIPKTSASFASLMTGLHPFIHKTKPNLGYLQKKYITLAEVLRLKGYYNYAIVDNGNLSHKFYFNQGFNKYVEVWDKIQEKTESTEFITKKALSFLNNNKKKPFFLWLHYIETHTPYLPPKKFIPKRPEGRDITKLKKRIIAGTLHERKALRVHHKEGYFISLYDGAIKYIDYEVGKIIDLFLKNKLEKNTIFIISSDHGEDLGEYNFYFNHGPLTFTSGIRVPLIFYMPGIRAKRVNRIVSLMDIYPTLMNILGLTPAYKLQGKNFFSKNNRKLFVYGLKSLSVINNDFHYTKVFNQISTLLGIDNKYVFKFKDDPYEKKNLISKYTLRAYEFEKLYKKFLSKYGYLTKKKSPNNKKKLSEKDLKSLKTLGYIN